MRNHGAKVTSLKQQLYHGHISAAQYADAIAPIRAQHSWIFNFWNVNWLYFAQASLFCTALIMVVVSLATPPPDPGVVRFTWYGATSAEKAATRASWSATDVVLSGIVVTATLIFYITFW